MESITIVCPEGEFKVPRHVARNVLSALGTPVDDLPERVTLWTKSMYEIAGALHSLRHLSDFPDCRVLAQKWLSRPETIYDIHPETVSPDAHPSQQKLLQIRNNSIQFYHFDNVPEQDSFCYQVRPDGTRGYLFSMLKTGSGVVVTRYDAEGLQCSWAIRGLTDLRLESNQICGDSGPWLVHVGGYCKGFGWIHTDGRLDRIEGEEFRDLGRFDKCLFLRENGLTFIRDPDGVKLVVKGNLFNNETCVGKNTLIRYGCGTIDVYYHGHIPRGETCALSDLIKIRSIQQKDLYNHRNYILYRGEHRGGSRITVCAVVPG